MTLGSLASVASTVEVWGQFVRSLLSSCSNKYYISMDVRFGLYVRRIGRKWHKNVGLFNINFQYILTRRAVF